jgi:hypothetical protein
MATRNHRPLKVLAFNANGIGRQRYELSKQPRDLHVDVALFSETHLKPHERYFIPNFHLYRTDRYPGRKGGTAVAVRTNTTEALYILYMCVISCKTCKIYLTVHTDN